MAYTCTYSQTYADIDEFYDRMVTGILNCGWELYDTIATRNKVFRSNGESGNFEYGYVHLYVSGVNVLRPIYQMWDIVNHVGVGSNIYSWPSQSQFTFVANSPLTIYGDKDFVSIASGHSNSAATVKYGMFGFMTDIYDDTKTRTTSTTSSGVNQTMYVQDTTGFTHERNYIMCHVDFGRYTVEVQEVLDSTSVIIASMPVEAPSDTLLTAMVNFGGKGYQDLNLTWTPVTYYNISGFTNISARNSPAALSTITDSAQASPNAAMNRYLMKTPYFQAAVSTYLANPMGHGLGDHMFYIGTTGFDATYKNDFYVIGPWESMTITNTSTATTARDSSKSWTTNEHTGKQLVCISGASEGQTRQIASNTADTLTLAVDWFVDPDIDDILRIVDGDVYRALTDFAVKETITSEVTS